MVEVAGVDLARVDESYVATGLWRSTRFVICSFVDLLGKADATTEC